MPGSRQCCCYGEFLCTARIFKSIRLQSVQPENHRAENQPDSSTTGESLLENSCVCRHVSETYCKSHYFEHRT